MRVPTTCLFLALTAPAVSADPPSLKKGERIIFLGDSITEAGTRTKGYVTLIKTALDEKHKDLGIEVIGAGISGNKVPDLLRRLDKDVLLKKPTLVVVYIGINDVWHGQKDPKLGTTKDKYEAGLTEVVGKIKATGARVVLCTPTVIGEKRSNNLDGRLDEYSNISRKVAREAEIPLCDLRAAFRDYLVKNNKDDKAQGIFTTDTVHLNDAGNKLVAETILKTIDK